ncbi:hypothetical protein [Butyrivibrio sp. MC2013]|uniref:hypothetical protein n=1 Tax=Butyrivibrio sp. MC2013 TaxID=1280686 RepID=UPI000686DA43|nr:hypothetical protein [Butyrivibrio sp. MC2013]
MMKNTSLDFIKRILLITAVLLALSALVTVIFDPFYHYHKNLSFLTPVLTEKEYQVPGTLRNFDYDAVIVGSSVAENNHNDWFDEDFGVTSIKAIRSYGATADLVSLLDIAYEEHDLSYVFYNIDTTSLPAEPLPTFETTGAPVYLYDRNPFNDYKYLFNKDVLLQRIPYMLVKSMTGDADPDLSYNWEESKVFAADAAMSHYDRPSEVSEIKAADHYLDNARANTALICERVEAHPETRFVFFFPVYSILYWDSVVMNGDLDAYLSCEELAMRELLKYDNAEVYFFQNVEDIAADLDNYMDTLHFTSDINHYMEQCFLTGEHKVTEDGLEELMTDMKDFALRACLLTSGLYQ